MTDYFIGVDQIIPDWLRLCFRERLKLVRSGIKSRFGIMGL